MPRPIRRSPWKLARRRARSLPRALRTSAATTRRCRLPTSFGASSTSPSWSPTAAPRPPTSPSPTPAPWYRWCPSLRMRSRRSICPGSRRSRARTRTCAGRSSTRTQRARTCSTGPTTSRRRSRSASTSSTPSSIKASAARQARTGATARATGRASAAAPASRSRTTPPSSIRPRRGPTTCASRELPAPTRAAPTSP